MAQPFRLRNSYLFPNQPVLPFLGDEDKTPQPPFPPGGGQQSPGEVPPPKAISDVLTDEKGNVVARADYGKSPFGTQVFEWRKVDENKEAAQADKEIRTQLTKDMNDHRKAQDALDLARQEKRDEAYISNLQRTADIAERKLQFTIAQGEARATTDVAKNELNWAKYWLTQRKAEAPIREGMGRTFRYVDPFTKKAIGDWQTIPLTKEEIEDRGRVIEDRKRALDKDLTNQAITNAEYQFAMDDLNRKQKQWQEDLKRDSVMTEIFGPQWSSEKRQKKWWEYGPGGMDFGLRQYKARMAQLAEPTATSQTWNPTTLQMETVSTPVQGPKAKTPEPEPLPEWEPAFGGEPGQLGRYDNGRPAFSGVLSPWQAENYRANLATYNAASTGEAKARMEWQKQLPVQPSLAELETRRKGREQTLGLLGRRSPFYQR